MFLFVLMFARLLSGHCRCCDLLRLLSSAVFCERVSFGASVRAGESFWLAGLTVGGVLPRFGVDSNSV